MVHDQEVLITPSINIAWLMKAVNYTHTLSAIGKLMGGIVLIVIRW